MDGREIGLLEQCPHILVQREKRDVFGKNRLWNIITG
jgi:hypothetical protein